MGRRVLVTFTIMMLVLISPPAYSGGSPEPGRDEQPVTDEPTSEQESPGAFTERRDEREALVERHIKGEGISDTAVLRAMRRVPRHEFVPQDYRRAAYDDRPLPIGQGQTISQPYVVALMTELLEPTAESRVLEVGTGSGYQAAVLAEIVEEVYTIEIIEPLATSARARLERLGYDNVTVRAGDGYYGLPEAAPFDAVIVTAAAGHIPPPLLDQLEPGGRMIIPVGPVHAVQQLILVLKDANGEISTRQLLPVRFVPMTGRVQE
jgi:protein-L-isoaspartate(D-aspartate) O-methyltransferase